MKRRKVKQKARRPLPEFVREDPTRLPGTEFHAVRAGPWRFSAALGPGGVLFYAECPGPQGGSPLLGVGTTRIETCFLLKDAFLSSAPSGIGGKLLWSLGDFTNPRKRILLETLDHVQIRRLENEFGLPTWNDRTVSYSPFSASRTAYRNLRAYAKMHPIVFARFEGRHRQEFETPQVVIAGEFTGTNAALGKQIYELSA